MSEGRPSESAPAPEPTTSPDHSRSRAETADDDDRIADRRDQVAAERDRIADERDRIADERDRIADERDRDAHRRRFLALGGGIVAASCAVAFLNLTGILGASTAQGSSSQSPRAGSLSDKDDAGMSLELPQAVGEPCLFAERSSLAELTVKAEVPFWLPKLLATSKTDFTGAWLCGPDAPLLTFGAMQITYEPGWSDIDVDHKWSDLIRDYGGYVEMVKDHPALVQPLTKESTRPQVMMIHEGVLIRILGDAPLPVEDLVELARSLNLGRPIS